MILVSSAVDFEIINWLINYYPRFKSSRLSLQEKSLLTFHRIPHYRFLHFFGVTFSKLFHFLGGSFFQYLFIYIRNQLNLFVLYIFD